MRKTAFLWKRFSGVASPLLGYLQNVETHAKSVPLRQTNQKAGYTNTCTLKLPLWRRSISGLIGPGRRGRAEPWAVFLLARGTEPVQSTGCASGTSSASSSGSETRSSPEWGRESRENISKGEGRANAVGLTSTKRGKMAQIQGRQQIKACKSCLGWLPRGDVCLAASAGG